MTSGGNRQLLDRPYSERQLIVVTDDALVDAARKEEQKFAQDKGLDWKRIAEAAMTDVLRTVPFGNLAAEVTKEAIRAWGRAKASGIQIMPVGKTAAAAIVFPPGHPRDGVLYIGHPALPNVYYTMADFHRVTFEHKFCEAIELLRSLGATQMRVARETGWSKDFSARLSVPLGAAEENVSGNVSSHAGSAHQILYEATFSKPAKASIPRGLVWYRHEPTWQAIAKGRLRSGLSNFRLSVLYRDDFGVNAGLKATVLKSGLDLGGKFEDHESTTWHLEGKFLAAG